MRFVSGVAAVGMVLFGAVAMGCSPSAKAPASPASVTTITQASVAAPKKPILPYVNFDDVDTDGVNGPNDFGEQTWGATYAQYAGYNPEFGF